MISLTDLAVESTRLIQEINIQAQLKMARRMVKEDSTTKKETRYTTVTSRTINEVDTE